MKNQEIKGNPGLILEKLDESELQTVIGGGNCCDDDGCIKIFFIMMRNRPNLADDVVGLLFGYEGAYKKMPMFSFVCTCVFAYGFYSIISAVERKLKRKPVNKVARQDATVPADKNDLQI